MFLHPIILFFQQEYGCKIKEHEFVKRFYVGMLNPLCFTFLFYFPFFLLSKKNINVTFKHMIIRRILFAIGCILMLSIIPNF